MNVCLQYETTFTREIKRLVGVKDQEQISLNFLPLPLSLYLSLAHCLPCVNVRQIARAQP